MDIDKYGQWVRHGYNNVTHQTRNLRNILKLFYILIKENYNSKYFLFENILEIYKINNLPY